ncbi:MAG: alpha/beta hydrolase [Myxococcaceae bacterium]
MRAGFLLCVSLLSSCVSAPIPMTSVKHELPAAKCLVVFLPGAGDSAASFERYGFVDALKQKGLSVDVIAADATLGYYMRGIMPERLDADVLQATRSKGYQQTWLIGMSMGGMGTLLYSHEHVDTVTGIFMLAPFLGDRSLTAEIHDAGGLAKWKAPAKVERITSDTYQRELWRWLQGVTAGTEKGPNLYLGWGTEDSLAPSAAVLAEALPKGHVFTTPGPHKWAPWKALLDQFLAESDFVRACQP